MHRHREELRGRWKNPPWKFLVGKAKGEALRHSSLVSDKAARASSETGDLCPAPRCGRGLSEPSQRLLPGRFGSRAPADTHCGPSACGRKRPALLGSRQGRRQPLPPQLRREADRLPLGAPPSRHLWDSATAEAQLRYSCSRRISSSLRVNRTWLSDSGYATFIFPPYTTFNHSSEVAVRRRSHLKMRRLSYEANTGLLSVRRKRKRIENRGRCQWTCHRSRNSPKRRTKWDAIAQSTNLPSIPQYFDSEAPRCMLGQSTIKGKFI